MRIEDKLTSLVNQDVPEEEGAPEEEEKAPEEGTPEEGEEDKEEW